MLKSVQKIIAWQIYISCNFFRRRILGFSAQISGRIWNIVACIVSAFLKCSIEHQNVSKTKILIFFRGLLVSWDSIKPFSNWPRDLLRLSTFFSISFLFSIQFKPSLGYDLFSNFIKKKIGRWMNQLKPKRKPMLCQPTYPTTGYTL